MRAEIPARYDHRDVESKWTRLWHEKNIFKSEPSDALQPFTIVMPPPNVTGVLHVGHVLNNTIQDVLARDARLKGFNVCWVPGTDHASIATEARVVRWLKQELGIKEKWELSRDEFLRYAWQWKEKHESIILEQLTRLGVSVDWSRKVFTMDDHYYWAVIHVFVRLYEDGLIYRDLRMIHWDPVARTALSDEEVQYREVEGKLYYVRYPLVEEIDGMKFLVVATTRPETILADTAVAVNPSDDRYKHVIGARVLVPLCDRQVPVIADERVDPEFGTGVLKVTPAHDPVDFEIGRDHGLPMINIFDESATLNENAGRFMGLSREQARETVVEELRDAGLLEKVENIKHSVGFSERTQVPVEARLSKQWFVRMKPLAELALRAVESGRIRIVPERFIGVYRNWLENVKDWCISRQLWWGHRIPVWYVVEGEEVNEEKYVVAHNEKEAYEKAREKYGECKLRQDPDVLDTWFSSWLWPLQVFRFFDKGNNRDFEYYYPTKVLVTAPEILFFWVARMIMAGEYFARKEPFKYVYLHGIIRDKYGRKMSKSLGNSPDVMELFDKYGADAVRLGVLMSSPAGNDLLFDEKLCETGRNFLNKLWNAFRLIGSWNITRDIEPSDSALALVRWMDLRIEHLYNEVQTDLSEFRISEALKILYSFVWDEFTSFYLEGMKRIAKDRKLPWVIGEAVNRHATSLLKLLHPFIPMITEELWSRINGTGEYLSLSRYEFGKTTVPEEFGEVNSFIRDSIPLLRRLKDIAVIDKDILLKVPEWLTRSPLLKELFKTVFTLLPEMEGVVKLSDTKPAVDGYVAFRYGKILAFFIPRDVRKLSEELTREYERLKVLIRKTEDRLNNEEFVKRAPAQVVDRERIKLADLKEKLTAVRESLESLGLSIVRDD